MSQKQLRPEDRAQLDAYLRGLEDKISANPSDDSSVDVLLSLLESYLPDTDGIGKYSDCQKQIFRDHTETDLRNMTKNTRSLVDHLRSCGKLLDDFNIYRQNNFTQAYQGKIHVINNVISDCDARVTLFTREKIISEICLDCFKVQILPASFLSLIKLHFILKYVELPRDCSRKSIIDMREYSPYPYKGVVYCQSEEEAQNCSDIVEGALKEIGVTDVVFGLSHGCTEFGIEYPEYKYSADGSHKSFTRPQSWARKEAEFMAAHPLGYVRMDYNTKGITIRDLICFCNWYHYADLIGDETCKTFDFFAVKGPFEHITEQAMPQAQRRKVELAELAEKAQRRA